MSTASNEERNEMHASGLWSMEKYSYVHKVGLNGKTHSSSTDLRLHNSPESLALKAVGTS